MSPTPLKKRDLKPGHRPTRACEECGEEFALKQYYQKFCSSRCRMVAYWRRRLQLA